MLRYWVEQIVAIELAAIVVIALTLAATIFAWMAVRRSKLPRS